MLSTENSGLTGLNFYCKKLKEEQIDFKTSRRRTIMTRAELCGTECRNTVEKISETENWFFEKIDKPLASLRKIALKTLLKRN